MSNERLVRIDCYGKDGMVRQSYGVERTVKEIGERMYGALDNGMIPVVRELHRDRPQESDAQEQSGGEDQRELRELRKRMRALVTKMENRMEGEEPRDTYMAVDWSFAGCGHIKAQGREAAVMQMIDKYLEWIDEDYEDE